MTAFIASREYAARTSTPLALPIGKDRPMALFKEGEAVWVQQPDGSARPGVFVGDGENATWFGGAPLAYVVYPDTKDGEEVNLMRVTARESNDGGA